METTTLKAKAQHRFKALLACAVSFALVAAMVPLAGLNVQTAQAAEATTADATPAVETVVVTTASELTNAIAKAALNPVLIDVQADITFSSQIKAETMYSYV